MPAQHQSIWRIQGRIRFIHFYFAPQQLDQLAVSMLDREPRSLDLHPRTYMDDPWLAAACRRLAQQGWHSLNQRLKPTRRGTRFWLICCRITPA